MKNNELREVKVEALGSTLETILKAVIELVRLWISRIKDDYARESLNSLADVFKEVIGALADADPNDKEQIQAIISKFLTDSDFVDNTKDELMQEIDKLNDERLKVVLASLLPVAFDIIKALFDDQPANEEQIKERLSDLVKGSSGTDLITAIISFIVKDESLARTIASIIISLLSGLSEFERQRERR